MERKQRNPFEQSLAELWSPKVGADTLAKLQEGPAADLSEAAGALTKLYKLARRAQAEEDRQWIDDHFRKAREGLREFKGPIRKGDIELLIASASFFARFIHDTKQLENRLDLASAHRMRRRKKLGNAERPGDDRRRADLIEAIIMAADGRPLAASDTFVEKIGVKVREFMKKRGYDTRFGMSDDTVRKAIAKLKKGQS